MIAWNTITVGRFGCSMPIAICSSRWANFAYAGLTFRTIPNRAIANFCQNIRCCLAVYITYKLCDFSQCGILFDWREIETFVGDYHYAMNNRQMRVDADEMKNFILKMSFCSLQAANSKRFFSSFWSYLCKRVNTDDKFELQFESG